MPRHWFRSIRSAQQEQVWKMPTNEYENYKTMRLLIMSHPSP